MARILKTWTNMNKHEHQDLITGKKDTLLLYEMIFFLSLLFSQIKNKNILDTPNLEQTNKYTL